MKRLEIRGLITISRLMQSNANKCVEITIQNESDKNVLILEMSFTNFARAVTGLSYQECKIIKYEDEENG